MDQINEFLSALDADNKISANTRNAYASDLSRFFDYLNTTSKQQPDQTQLTAKSFSRFLDHERKTGLKPSTLHRRRASLKKYAEFLQARGLVDQTTVFEIANWRRDLWEEIATRQPLCLSDEQVRILLDGIRVEEKPRHLRDLVIVSLILELGLSIGTLVELNLQDVNLRSKRIRIVGEENWQELGRSAQYLPEYLKESRPELTQSVNEAALFVSQMGGRITRQGVWQVVRAWGETVGLSVPLSPRILRHTAVRRMVDSGKPVGEIQRLLGHGNKHSTQALIRKLYKSQGRRRNNQK
jgi:integrase/recombinase XerD